jgi:hypothetical protein
MFPPKEIVHSRATAFERYVRELDARHLFKELSREVAERADTWSALDEIRALVLCELCVLGDG